MTELISEIKSLEEWNRLSDGEKVDRICEAMNEKSYDFCGLMCDHVIENGKVYMATVGYKEMPELVVLTLPEFVDEYDCWVVDDLIEKERRQLKELL